MSTAIPADWLADFEAASRRPLALRMRYAFIHTDKPGPNDRAFRAFDTMAAYRAWCDETSRRGSAMAAFEYRQALEIRDAFARHGVRYLFIGKSGAILLGYPDTTQDADLFVDLALEE